MRKVEKKEFESQFDVVKQNRFYQTLDYNDIIRLVEPYIETELGQEQQKVILQKFIDGLIEETLNNPLLIAPNDLFLLQVIESKNEKIYKTAETKGWKGDTIRYSVLDKAAMWNNLVKNSGYNWELVGEMNKKYEFYSVEISKEAQQKAMDKGRKGGKFLQSKAQWQIV